MRSSRFVTNQIKTNPIFLIFLLLKYSKVIIWINLWFKIKGKFVALWIIFYIHLTLNYLQVISTYRLYYESIYGKRYRSYIINVKNCCYITIHKHRFTTKYMKCYENIIYEKKLKEDSRFAADIAPFITLNQLVHITA